MIVRSPIKDIRTTGRSTQGVRLMKLESGDKVASAAKIVPEDEDENAEAAAAPAPKTPAAVEKKEPEKPAVKKEEKIEPKKKNIKRKK